MASTPFWYDDPNVLLQTAEIFPTASMSLSRQMNAVTRLVILVSGMYYWYLPRITVPGIGLATVAGIAALYYHCVRKLEVNPYVQTKESFDTLLSVDANVDADAKTNTTDKVDLSVYQEPTPVNPFGNVLLTDIVDHPQRKPAPPAFVESVREDITTQAVKMVQDMHPTQPNLVSRLYGNAEDRLEFEQSLRPFQSNPCTTVAGDIATFMEFCYGNTASFRDGECVLGSKQRPRFM